MVFCYSPNNNSYLDVISSLPSDISVLSTLLLRFLDCFGKHRSGFGL